MKSKFLLIIMITLQSISFSTNAHEICVFEKLHCQLLEAAKGIKKNCRKDEEGSISVCSSYRIIHQQLLHKKLRVQSEEFDQLDETGEYNHLIKESDYR